MFLTEHLDNDMKSYMKQKKENKDNLEAVDILKAYLAVISILKSKLALAEKEKKSELTIPEIYKIVSKEKQDISDAEQEFAKGERKDLVEECMYKKILLNKYLAILEPYMPKLLNEDEILDEVKNLAYTLNRVVDINDKGLFMKTLSAHLKGKADGKLINKVVTEYLNNK